MASRNPSQLFGNRLVNAMTARSNGPGASAPKVAVLIEAAIVQTPIAAAQAPQLFRRLRRLGARLCKCLGPQRGEAALCARAVALQYGIKARVIRGQLRAVERRMPEMNDAGGETSVLAAQAATQQPDQQIGIFTSPAGEAGIEAVDLLEIGTPNRAGAGARAAPLPRPQLTQRTERQPEQCRQPIDPTAQAVPHPPPRAPRLRSQLLAQHGIGEARREQHAVSGDEPSGFGEASMRGDEIVRRDAVAVEEDAVIASAGENGAVADFRGAKAAVFLPDVTERNSKSRAPALHHGRGRGARAVVGNHDLETAIALAR